MNKNIKPALLALGLFAAVGATATKTNSISAAIAAAGGALFGSTLAVRIADSKAQKREEAIRVATAFRAAYERNRGLVLPEEVSLHGEIDRENTIKFLDALAQEQSGEIVPMDKGAAYKFPHPSNVLDVLSQNAQAWAEAQTTALKQENETLKQQLNTVQQQLRLYQTVQQSSIEQVVNKAQAQLSDKPKDPWNNLL